MKKLFVIQPMTGFTDEQVYAARAIAKKEAEEIVGEELELIDQYVQDDPPEGMYSEERQRFWYLGHSIQLLGTTDYVITVKGFEHAPGCVTEYGICERYGIKILNQ